MIKLKKAVKKIKAISKGLREKKVSIDKVSDLLRKKHARHEMPRSRSYTAVAYFLKNKPHANRVYSAEVVLKDNESSTHYIGSATRDSLLKVFPQFSRIEGIIKKSDNTNLYKTFKFVK